MLLLFISFILLLFFYFLIIIIICPYSIDDHCNRFAKRKSVLHKKYEYSLVITGVGSPKGNLYDFFVSKKSDYIWPLCISS